MRKISFLITKSKNTLALMSRFNCVYLFLICCLAISTVSLQAHSAEEPLLVQEIRFDNENVIAIKQIVFEFNQNVAILGAVPGQAQIAAVSISNDLHQQCIWRFINLDKLACELKDSFKYLTAYDIRIDTSFTALGKPLETAAQRSLRTGLPTLLVKYHAPVAQFPKSMTIEDAVLSGIPFSAFRDHLKLKGPGGQYRNLSVRKGRKTYQKNDLEVSLPADMDITDMPDGTYQLILPKGLRLSPEQITLEEDLVLDEFLFSKTFRFYGFACVENGYPRKYRAVELDENLTLPCQPEKIALALSHPADGSDGNGGFSAEPNEQVDWLHGPQYQVNSVANHKRVTYQHLLLSGESEYILDLSKLKPKEQSFAEEPAVIRFTTRPSTPYWYFSQSLGTVVESDADTLPKFVRRNVDPLVQQLTAIHSAQELQQFLNGQSEPGYSGHLPIPPQSIHFYAEQPLDFRQSLMSSSGMVHTRLSGLSAVPYGFAEPALKDEDFMLQAADYDIVAWHEGDLLIQVTDWNAKAVAKVSVQLACKGLELPVDLGDTDSHGILWISASEWQVIYADLAKAPCWLWAQSGEKRAALSLPQAYHSPMDNINVFSWTAQPIYQPGEAVNIGFIGRQRSASGLLTVTDYSDYKVMLTFPDGKKAEELTLSNVSEQGFFSAKFSLPQDAKVGKYILFLTRRSDEMFSELGAFTVAEFTPPEFEFSVEVPSEITAGESLTALLSANRMNGAALKHARASFTANIVRDYQEPESWPDNYEFNSWDDFSRNKNGKETISAVNLSLDDKGQVSFDSEVLRSTVPYGKVILISEVTADDGETQDNRASIRYFSRDHYIGTRLVEKTNTIEVIAIDVEGRELSDIPVNIQVIPQIYDEEWAGESVKKCAFQRLPARCDFDTEVKRIAVEIVSGEQQYQWYRDYRINNNDMETPDFSEDFALVSDLSELQPVIVGETVSFNLRSSIAGTATFILQAGEIRKVWQEEVIAGSNAIDMRVDAGWLPYARLYASMPISRDVAQQRINEKLQAYHSDEPLPSHVIRELRDVRRHLHTKTMVQVKPSKSAPTVRLSVKHKEVTAGSKVDLSVTGDVDGESQVWMVNEALLNLLEAELASYDYQQVLSSSLSFEGGLRFDTLSNRLLMNLLLEKTGWLEKAEEPRTMRLKSRGGLSMAFSMPSTESALVEFNPQDFAQSIWLDTIKLQANQPQNIEIQLPQLIGRWKIIALTASTQQTFAVDAVSVSTVRDIEYFLDAPGSIIQNDKAQLAITQINKTDSPVEDNLTLWVNGTPSITLPVQLEAEGYQRVYATLPSLPVGKHKLQLTSQRQPGFEAFQFINVNASQIQIESTWLSKSSGSGTITRPDSFVSDSLEISLLDVGQQSPDWNALTDYNREYPHQCWEQTLSRAMVHQFNPSSSTIWADGDNQLNTLLARQDEFFDYDDLISFFPKMSGDPFLTAYTYLVSGWLQGSATPVEIDKIEFKKQLLAFIENAAVGSYLDVSEQAKSMALLALAINKDVSLEKALSLRQLLGNSDIQSMLLQALALKELGANPALYQEVLERLNDNQYVDDTHSLFDQNSEKCLAIATYEPGAKPREELIAQVLHQQQNQGHFGSTFSNAICAWALKEMPDTNASFAPVDFVMQDDVLTYQFTAPDKDPQSQHHWVKLTYTQSIQDAQPTSSGITMQRQLWVKSGEQWLPVTTDTKLRVGDIVKTKITLDSPKDRQHIAITDSIPGGFEAINPDINNRYYSENREQDWWRSNRIEIRDGKARWYIRYLDKGETAVSYFSRVRHVGQFQLAPAGVEAMYRSDVYSATEAGEISVGLE